MKTCVSMVRPKACALFFDRVIPFGCIDFFNFSFDPLSESYAGEEYVLDLHRAALDGMRDNREIIAELIFGSDHPGWSFVDEKIEEIFDTLFDLQGHARYTDEYSRAAFVNADYVLHQYYPIQLAATAAELQSNRITFGNSKPAHDQLDWLVRSFGDSAYALMCPEIGMDHDCGSFASDFEVSIELSKFPLIDERKLSWDQVVEIRRNPEARRRILRLEKFVFELMKAAAAPDQSIADQLEVSLEDHVNALKEHGISSSSSLISAVLDVRPITSALAAAVPGALANWGALATVGPAATIYVSNIAAQFFRSRRLQGSFLKRQPLTFLSHDLNLITSL